MKRKTDYLASECGLSTDGVLNGDLTDRPVREGSEFGRILGWRWFNSIPADQKFLASKCPDSLTDLIIEMLNISSSIHVLEPSAGTGGIRDKLTQKTRHVVSVELNKKSFEELDKVGGININANFLLSEPKMNFDCVVMCPPKDFLPHVHHAMSFLKSDGKLVAVVQYDEKSVLELDQALTYTPLPHMFVFNGNSVQCGVITNEMV